ncbi:aldo/keto reductase [Prochlorococcus marinus]|uniref:aldo/keto reductase n=1 Tax=Prochlorococcus marinus TaxID=1219 RepID=UPI0007B3B904|nr:aldo/keto reductase [Prochlorococcus marinus]KZR73708.1 Aldo/keto reductase family protein [Prochlorococcus marinus str. MIT 1320]
MELCLGTVQLGQDYGITNKTGKPKQQESESILEFAAKEKIKYLDTAQAYGSSEEVIGKSNSRKCFKIITKLKPLKAEEIGNEINVWNESIEKSLNKLNIKTIDTLLLHKSSDFPVQRQSIMKEWITKNKEIGNFKRFGLSIYEKEELKDIDIGCVDVIQLPMSIYDQRHIENGLIGELNNERISVHVRSIFLQGLILTEGKYWPDFISENLRKHHLRWTKGQIEKNQSMLEGAINFIKSIENIEAAIVGITNMREIRDIIRIWKRSKQKSHMNTIWSWKNINDIDPRVWKEN